MSQRFQRIISNGLLAFVATLVVHGVYTRGRPILGTDTALYIDLAEDLLHGRWNNVFTPDAVRWTKLIYIAVLALARRFAPAYWKAIMVAINLVCSAATAAILTRFIFRATRSMVPTIAALLYYLAIVDIAYWVAFVLTDLPYVLTALLPFVVIGRAIIGEPLRHHRLLLLLSCLGAAMSRPPGVFVALTALFAEIVFVPPPEQHPRLRKALLWTLLAGAIVAFCARTYVISQPERWPFRWIRARIDVIAEIDKKGEVLFMRRETYRPPPRTLADYAEMEVERFARVFQFAAHSFSLRHKLVNWLVFGSMYLFGIYAVIDALRRAERRRRALVLTTLLWIGVSALFVALTMLDSEWRYRVPLLPQFIALAAFGIDAARRCSSRSALSGVAMSLSMPPRVIV